MNGRVIYLSDGDFNTKVLKAKKAVLVDFWAEWCSPCKIISPILDEIADDYIGKLIIGKLNVEHNSVIPVHYAIRSIPTLVLFKDGELIDKKIGVLSKSELQEFLNKNI